MQIKSLTIIPIIMNGWNMNKELFESKALLLRLCNISCQF
jgi:hypothetical protein